MSIKTTHQRILKLEKIKEETENEDGLNNNEKIMQNELKFFAEKYDSQPEK